MCTRVFSKSEAGVDESCNRGHTCPATNVNLKACTTWVCPFRLFNLLIDIILDKNHKVAKLYEESDTKRNDRTTHGDQEDGDDDDENIAAGPELPLDYEAGESDDEEGRFFGGGITVETAGALDFIDERDSTDPLVRSRKVYVETGHANSRLSEARKHQSSLATETCSPI